MAAQPYTQRFVLAAGDHTYYWWTCPPGYRAVVTSFVTWSAAAGQSCYLFIAGVPVYGRLSQATGESGSLQLRAAVYAGEVVQISKTSTDVYAVVSGYIFVDPTGPLGTTGSGMVAADELPAGGA